VDRIRKKYPQNLPGEESEQIESHEETVAKDDSRSLLLANSAGGIFNVDRLWQFLHTGPRI
jgi:hypothetical protein